MSKIRGKNTSLELLVRKRLFSKGFRYLIHSPLPGKPDIVFVKPKIVVFVNGCFWHRHGCLLSAAPKTNSKFWEDKLEGNRERDAKNHKLLARLGWRVIVLWECDIEADVDQAILKVIQGLNHGFFNSSS
jgi:DNA mismatch endonuclease, patch repair protein